MRRECTLVQREFRRPKNRRLSFPLFRETTKEDAISYRDWCSEIEDTLEHGHNAAKVKEAMFAPLEGMARDNAKMINENGDLHVTRILDSLDSLYGVSMTFQLLNAALCGLQQRQTESAHAYYNCMVQITIILREHHSNHYRPGELVGMSKDCFYAGLLPKNRPMVVHLKDQPHTTPLDLLKALLEQEENDALMRTRYPPSKSSRTSQPSKPVECYHQQLPAEKRNDGYTVRPAQLDTDPTEVVPKANSVPLTNTLDALETWYNDGFLIGLHQAAEVSKVRHRRCFNCQKEGHRWCQCKEPLIQEMLDGSAIRPSQSPWCNAVVLVRKKDGSLQFCIDFRRLNARNKKDTYLLPRIQEKMESMVGARHFSCMDLKSRFWQVQMDEESRQYTAFTVGSIGVYEFLRMPYGLCNAPAMFQHLMQNCLGELNLTYALIYLDDVIVYSKTEEEHLVRLRTVLERFMEHGLKLKPSKCNFFRTEISYLGHKVSAAGMEPCTDGLKGIAKIAPPLPPILRCEISWARRDTSDAS